MLDFTRSFITWTILPRERHPYYKWDGGFVGDPGDVYRVRTQVDSTMFVIEPDTGVETPFYLSYPCRTEMTIATDQFFMIPSGEWRACFGRDAVVPIARRPASEQEVRGRTPFSERYSDMDFALVDRSNVDAVTNGQTVNEATQAGDIINGQTTYRDASTGLDIRIEFPIRLMNLDPEHAKFQLCCGPVILPDLTTWDGRGLDRVFLAEVAFSAFDYVEFILRREIEPAESEKAWFHEVRGRDRLELWDPENRPPVPIEQHRPSPTVYHETRAFPAKNVILRAS